MKTQRVCLFCALRYASNEHAFARRSFLNARRYVSKASSLRSPAAAVAQRRDEEDDEEELRTKAFPAAAHNVTHWKPRQQQPSGAVSYSISGQERNKSYTRPPHQQRSPASSRFGAFIRDAAAGPPRARRSDGLALPGRDANHSRTNSSQQEWKIRRTLSNTLEDDPRHAAMHQRGNSVRTPGREHRISQSTGFDAFNDAVRASGREQNHRQPRGPSRFNDRSNPSPPTKGPQTQVPPSADALDGNLAYEREPVDEVTEHESKRRRASREDRYASDDEAPEISKEELKAQLAKERAKARELENVEAQLEAEDGRRSKKKKKVQNQPVAQSRATAQPRLEIPEFISVQNMSQALGLRLDSFLEKLEEEGFEGARHDHLLDSGTAAMLAEMYGFDPVVATAEAQQDLVARPPPEDTTTLPSRPPIVTIMGHVDHGKTTILDYLRKANVVASEHGGITQHIGAFSVVMPGTQRKITFLDTPGHAAFLDMRRRGANVTDIVVLVVAADDSVKPQTIEAIKHSKEAGVQIIVAINKVDKADADIQRVKTDLSIHDVVVEDFGGDYQAIPLSGKTGQGMEDLEEAIITLADVSDYRAETEGRAEGWIIESKVTTAGRVATVLVRRGTLRPGDCIVAGSTWARVRTLRNDNGDLVSEALPGTPVQIDGWRGEDPTAGLEVLQADDEQHAKDVVDLRLEKADSLRTATDMAAINASRSEAAEARAKVLAWQAEQGFATRKQSRIRLRDSRSGWLDVETDSGPRKIHFVVKADVAGSTEAIVAAVSSIGNDMIQANVIHSGTGMLTESDIRMLATSGELCYAITFNQMVDGTIYRLAEAAGIGILDHNIIYKVTDAVKEKLTAELPPLVTTKVLGEAEVGRVFDIGIKSKGKKAKLKIAGCRVTNGIISRATKVRVLRDGETIFTGALESLKNVKKDVTEMRKGTECGMAFEEWEEMQEGDHVQCFEEMSEPRKLY